MKQTFHGFADPSERRLKGQPELTGNIGVGYNLRAFGSNGHIKWVNLFHYEDDGAFDYG